MPFTYCTYTALPSEPILAKLLDLLIGIFTNQSREEWLADLTAKATYPGFQLLVVLDGDRLVGCKLGYTWQPDGKPTNTFYSWLGGVDPAYRGQGIAAELMRLQHEACQTARYVTIRTHTYNQWRDMLILNLRHGFHIVGTQPGKRGLTIILEKTLV
ncbi:GNAT family N-acetyltransferase [Fibrella forsythiae]|uniref:GNAT family N-acetyltransferase n=1 Tax=Fibrella forsythiae TaxID=2817061 RepID=A0ABS3JP11_9BACT|nr:GNAT family N-acetyltransferase [Fibrella forsythiae]MBO0951744.1 GNAT family N-acetyltransferase [Fibrella forsythiae]